MDTVAHNDYELRFSDILEFRNEVTFNVKNNQKQIMKVFQ